MPMSLGSLRPDDPGRRPVVHFDPEDFWKIGDKKLDSGAGSPGCSNLKSAAVRCSRASSRTPFAVCSSFPGRGCGAQRTGPPRARPRQPRRRSRRHSRRETTGSGSGAASSCGPRHPKGIEALVAGGDGPGAVSRVREASTPVIAESSSSTTAFFKALLGGFCQCPPRDTRPRRETRSTWCEASYIGGIRSRMSPSLSCEPEGGRQGGFSKGGPALLNEVGDILVFERCRATSCGWGVLGFGLSTAAAAPSPFPVNPWHEAQCLPKRLFPSRRCLGPSANPGRRMSAVTIPIPFTTVFLMMPSSP